MTTLEQPRLNKIAEITLYFWILKILATTLGETAGDFLSMTLQLGYLEGLAITTGVLVVLVAIQISLNRFVPLPFWGAIVATTTAGTEVSDFMDRSLNIGYLGGSLILVIALLATLGIWYRRDGNVNVDPILRKDAEITFWIAVVFSNSLGTAFGDLLVDDLGFSFLTGSLVTAAIMGVVAILHYSRAINDIALFWVAFIFTRPFGATFGDFLTKPLASGGLDLPRGFATIVTLALMGLVLFWSLRSSNSGVSSRPEADVQSLNPPNFKK
jgi:uncharacterized membrane-anchored protein